MFECDVKLSADDVAFLLHDSALERTTSGLGTAGERPWAALSQLDAGGWHGARHAGEAAAHAGRDRPLRAGQRPGHQSRDQADTRRRDAHRRPRRARRGAAVDGQRPAAAPELVRGTGARGRRRGRVGAAARACCSTSSGPAGSRRRSASGCRAVVTNYRLMDAALGPAPAPGRPARPRLHGQRPCRPGGDARGRRRWRDHRRSRALLGRGARASAERPRPARRGTPVAHCWPNRTGLPRRLTGRQDTHITPVPALRGTSARASSMGHGPRDTVLSRTPAFEESIMIKSILAGAALCSVLPAFAATNLDHRRQLRERRPGQLAATPTSPAPTSPAGSRCPGSAIEVRNNLVGTAQGRQRLRRTRLHGQQLDG